MAESRKTLNQFLIEAKSINTKDKDYPTQLLNAIATNCKQIAHLVDSAEIAGLRGYAESENVQGEAQKKLDILSNQIMVDGLKSTGQVAAMVSEENEDVIQIPPQLPKGKYLVCFDPLDGSSNSDINGAVGTIFSIFKTKKTTNRLSSVKTFLKAGKEQVCAGFCLYGPSTTLVLTLGDGVHAFSLDKSIGEFILTDTNMRIPEETTEFAINMSRYHAWEPPVRHYIDECLQGGKSGLKQYNMRWNASMVAEVYRILKRGGIFLYPMDSRNKKQGGRLRLMYELSPMSFIVEQAGGLSSTGNEPILELQPEGIHQRAPVILGSKQEVEAVIAYYQLDQ